MGVFKRELIIEVSSKTKSEVLKEISEFLKSKTLVKNSEEFLLEMMKREEHSTTGIGFGIAIPHAKSQAVVEPFVVVAKCQHDVEWNSLDDQPVRLVFAIGVPQNAPDEHLKILAKLSAKLMYEDFREALFKARTADEIYAVLKEIDSNA
ncbi:PTS sugar transporter subunit IIA [Fervidobacterium thailandense]|uniref:PTS EIIA type-2 domain-containing protein n=1 Tax=Fervidobacterium thailandense TaxID=1008305 RepID=A0A1E3G247_9BACT|nr:PTS sugar transporter subunit IIA [Fervidobacterium thailandense]ODN29953.1 hypothetical protein A4H02_08080 [Fervidobacterium thailandense]